MSDATINATSRRRFLGGAAALGLAAAVLPGRAGAAGNGSSTRAAAEQYGASRFQLDLDGQSAGFVTGVEGGSAVGEVAIAPVNGSHAEKHLAGLQYEELGFRLGLGMGQPMYEWIKQTLDAKRPRKDGALVEATHDLSAIERREFVDALITEIGFPALDGASKDPAALTVKVAPGGIRFAPASGKVQEPLAKEKTWLASGFRFELDGIDTSRASRIEAFTLRQGASGGLGSSERPEPGRLEFPNLTVTFAATHADDLLGWHDDFLIHGNSGEEREKRRARSSCSGRAFRSSAGSSSRTSASSSWRARPTRAGSGASPPRSTSSG
jgi:hypothetical protein